MLRGTEVAGKGCDALHSSFEARGLPRPEASQERKIRKHQETSSGSVRRDPGDMGLHDFHANVLAHVTINATAWCAPKVAVHNFSWITMGSHGGTCGARAIWPAFGPHSLSS